MAKITISSTDLLWIFTEKLRSSRFISRSPFQSSIAYLSKKIIRLFDCFGVVTANQQRLADGLPIVAYLRGMLGNLPSIGPMPDDITLGRFSK